VPAAQRKLHEIPAGFGGTAISGSLTSIFCCIDLVAVDISQGVPVIASVSVFIAMPVGSDGDTLWFSGDVPPPVTGVKDVAA
jgi:hypothetical protein